MLKRTFLLLLALCSISFTACKTKPTILLPQPVLKTTGDLPVAIYPLVEMMNIIIGLVDTTESFISHNENVKYIKEVKEYFKGFEDHKAVQYFVESAQKGFTYEAPPTVCMYIEDDFTVSSFYKESDIFSSYKGDLIDINKFAKLLKSFYIDTDFESFYNEHKAFYSELINNYIASFPKADIVKQLTGYFNSAPSGGFGVVLMPLSNGHNYGATIIKDNKEYILSFSAPGTMPDESELYFGDERGISALLFHEFGHSFIPINDENNENIQVDIKRAEYLNEGLKGNISGSYGSWPIAYEELVLRATVIDNMKALFPDYYVKKGLVTENYKNGFKYISSVYFILPEFTQNRDKYKSFEDFVPFITDTLLKDYPKQ